MFIELCSSLRSAEPVKVLPPSELSEEVDRVPLHQQAQLLLVAEATRAPSMPAYAMLERLMRLPAAREYRLRFLLIQAVGAVAVSVIAIVFPACGFERRRSGSSEAVARCERNVCGFRYAAGRAIS